VGIAASGGEGGAIGVDDLHAGPPDDDADVADAADDSLGEGLDGGEGDESAGHCVEQGGSRDDRTVLDADQDEVVSQQLAQAGGVGGDQGRAVVGVGHCGHARFVPLREGATGTGVRQRLSRSCALT
jgi:hypothetical protein